MQRFGFSIDLQVILRFAVCITISLPQINGVFQFTYRGQEHEALAFEILLWAVGLSLVYALPYGWVGYRYRTKLWMGGFPIGSPLVGALGYWFMFTVMYLYLMVTRTPDPGNGMVAAIALLPLIAVGFPLYTLCTLYPIYTPADGHEFPLLRGWRQLTAILPKPLRFAIMYVVVLIGFQVVLSIIFDRIPVYAMSERVLYCIIWMLLSLPPVYLFTLRTSAEVQHITSTEWRRFIISAVVIFILSIWITEGFFLGFTNFDSYSSFVAILIYLVSIIVPVEKTKRKHQPITQWFFPQVKRKQDEIDQ